MSNPERIYCDGGHNCSHIARWWWTLVHGATARDYSSFRIIVADDEPAITDSVSQVVKGRFGAQVDVASSGDAVLAALREAPYDVLISDMSMPGINGLELLGKVRQLSPEVDILVMTGYTEAFPYVQVVQAGASDFIGKPHQAAELEAKLLRIFAERNNRDARALAEQKYRSLFEFCMNGMVVLTQDSLTILDVNKAFTDLIGQPSEEFIGKPLSDMLAADERSRFETALSIFERGGQGTLGDVMFKHPSGSELSLDVSVTFINNPLHPMVFLTFKDVTEKRRLEEQLAAAAQTDELTALFNQRAFRTRLEAAVSRAEREELSVSLVFIDLDDFKRCNDTYGHQVGDLVLARVGEVIRKGIRNGADSGFRYGGDEFAALLMGAPIEVGARVADRMRQEFIKGQCYGTTMSIGIAEFREGMHATDFVLAADKALYEAKAKGKNCVASATRSDVS